MKNIITTIVTFLILTSSLWAQNPSVSSLAYFTGGTEHDYLKQSFIHNETGNIIEIYETQSRDLMVSGQFACDTLITCCDTDYNIYIRVVDPISQQIVAARYYGGAGNERKPRGRIYNGVLYMTCSVDEGSSHLATLPSHVGPIHQGEIDVMVVAFDLQTLTTIAQTFRGGIWTDMPGDIAIDSRGVFVAVSTHESSHLPYFNGGEENHGQYDVNIVMLSHNLSNSYFSGNFGGNLDDGYDADDNSPIRLDFDPNGRLILFSNTESTDLTSVGGGYWVPGGGVDILMMILNVDANNSVTLVTQSILGSAGNDEITDMKVIGNEIIATGYSNGNFPSDVPCVYADTTTNGFAFSINAAITNRNWSLLAGGNGDDFVYGLDVTNNYVFLGGQTLSNSGFTGVSGYQTSYHGERDGFVLRFSRQNLSDISTSYLGGIGVDGISTVLYHPLMDKVLTGGYTGSPYDFPTNFNGMDNSHSGKIDGFQFGFNIELGIGEITGLGENTNLPVEYALSQNYPNPFNPTTTISFALPEATQVSLKIYDVLGREASSLLSGVTVAAGHHSIVWDASRFSSGTYFYTIQAGDFIATHKMILMK